jgi:hypothetical protein
VIVNPGIVFDFELDTMIDEKRQRHRMTPDCGFKKGVVPVMSNLDQRCKVVYLGLAILGLWPLVSQTPCRGLS